MPRCPSPHTTKHGRVSKSFIKKVLKLGVYWNISSIFFSDRLFFFLLKNKYLLSIFSANRSPRRFFKAPNAASRTGFAWQIILKPSVRFICFFSMVKRYYQLTVHSIFAGFTKQTSAERYLADGKHFFASIFVKF